eukprot:gene20708-27517_t
MLVSTSFFRTRSRSGTAMRQLFTQLFTMMPGVATCSVLVYVSLTNLGAVFYLQSNGYRLTDFSSDGGVIEFIRQISLPQLWLLLKDILNNEAAIFLALNWFFSVCTAAGLVTTVLYMGKLSQRETSRMAERLVKYIVQKSVFLGAMSIGFNPSEVMMWLVWFYMVGFWRIFAGAAKDRMEALAMSPRSQAHSHVRAVSLLFLIMIQDAMSMYALFSFTWHGYIPLSKALLCAFDTAIILLEITKGIIVYGE